MDTELRQMVTVTVVGLLLAVAVVFLATPKFKLFGDHFHPIQPSLTRIPAVFLWTSL